jgi:hypothetical protein
MTAAAPTLSTWLKESACSPERSAPRVRTAPPPRPSGPVLMADLVTQIDGRPCLLDHWSRPGERDGH